MVHTVGLMGANGLVGAATARALAQAAKEDKIQLVILHRSGGPPKGLDNHRNIELRVLDLDGPAEDIEKTVQGISVFISAIGFGALPSEPKLVDALEKSPDLITYVPSTFSTTWTEEDKADAKLGPIVNFIESGWNRAKEQGIGITSVYTGIFDIYFFEYGFVGCVLKQNLVWANKKQMHNRIPITTIEHLAQGLARLATSDPQSIKNTEHSFVTFWPTGEELVDLYTKINGKPAEVKDFTDKDREEISADAAAFGAAKVGYWDHWESGKWDYESKGKVYDQDYHGPSIEGVARRFA